MEQAIFGLVGVIIGGVITGLGPYFLATRADRRRARAAARLLEAELRAITSYLGLAADERRHEPRADRDALYLAAITSSLPSVRLWEAHRATLSEVLSAKEWHALSLAYEAIAALRGIDSRNLVTDDGQIFDSPYLQVVLGEFIRDIESGAEAVSRLADSGLAASDSLRRERLISWKREGTLPQR